MAGSCFGLSLSAWLVARCSLLAARFACFGSGDEGAREKREGLDGDGCRC